MLALIIITLDSTKSLFLRHKNPVYLRFGGNPAIFCANSMFATTSRLPMRHDPQHVGAYGDNATAHVPYDRPVNRKATNADYRNKHRQAKQDSNKERDYQY